MSICILDERIIFPHPDFAEENGLLAIGGDLRPERLLAAYRQGIFPWSGPDDPLLWWFISPRLVLFPEEFTIPGRLARYRRGSSLNCSCDRAFAEVINHCARVRLERGESTWISAELAASFTRLHRLGYAHSVECWQNGELVGGLYGLALGKVFFGESMFSRTRGASQFALIHLVDTVLRKDFRLIDCQMTTSHLLRFGAREISGKAFRSLLHHNITNLNPQESWQHEEPRHH